MNLKKWLTKKVGKERMIKFYQAALVFTMVPVFVVIAMLAYALTIE